MRIGFGQYSEVRMSSIKETEVDVSARKPQSRKEDSLSGDQVSVGLAKSTLVVNVMEEPDVRQARVGALRMAVEKGDYSVDSRQIADAMRREFSVVA